MSVLVKDCSGSQIRNSYNRSAAYSKRSGHYPLLGSFAMELQIQSTPIRGEKQMKAMMIALLAAVLSAQSTPGSRPTQLPPASEMKTLGLVGGTSWYSTVDYYRYINKAVNDAYGDNTNPPLIIYNLNQQRIQELQARNQWDKIAVIDADAAARLRRSGAQAILLCSNPKHKVYAQVARRVD